MFSRLEDVGLIGTSSWPICWCSKTDGHNGFSVCAWADLLWEKHTGFNVLRRMGHRRDDRDILAISPTSPRRSSEHLLTVHAEQPMFCLKIRTQRSIRYAVTQYYYMRFRIWNVESSKSFCRLATQLDVATHVYTFDNHASTYYARLQLLADPSPRWIAHQKFLSWFEIVPPSTILPY